MKRLIIMLVFSIFLCSCETKKRLLRTKEKTEETKNKIVSDSAALHKIQQAVIKKDEDEGLDSSISNKFREVIAALKQNLKKAGKTVQAVEFFLEDKSNFISSNYDKNVSDYVSQLDSFNLHSDKRDRIYELLNEAVKVKAFEKYGLGAFFDPGVYKIEPSGVALLEQSFQPAIDSMAAFSNRYADVKRGIHLVIVGYADAIPIVEGSDLYNELKQYIKKETPTKAELNLVLSDLRAAELLDKLTTVVRNNASKFTRFNQLSVSTVSYGRGEALPFKNITNYTKNDERRRVVVFYWAILPELKDL